MEETTAVASTNNARVVEEQGFPTPSPFFTQLTGHFINLC